jgi:hypothetical protein
LVVRSEGFLVLFRTEQRVASVPGVFGLLDVLAFKTNENLLQLMYSVPRDCQFIVNHENRPLNSGIRPDLAHRLYMCR